jgi:single-stranded-DNA-specific exonuclease
MAAGLTVETAKLGDLRAISRRAAGPRGGAASRRCAAGRWSADRDGATLDLIELLEQAGPYGSAIPSPLFAFPAHRVVYADAAGTDHIRCTVAASDGTRIKAIAFRAMGTELGELLFVRAAVSLAYRRAACGIDDWSGKAPPQPANRGCGTSFMKFFLGACQAGFRHL